MTQVPLVSQYDPYSQPAQQLQQLQQQQQQLQQPQVSAEPDMLRNLMVNYIPTTVDEVQLRQLFERYGQIESVKIVCDRETRQSRGFGFVKFHSASSAQQAITALNGFSILNKRLKVALAANGHQRGGAAGQVGENNGYFGGYGGYGAYPYAQQQMMAMYAQQYMMQAPAQSQPQAQSQQQQQQQPQMPPPPQQQQQQQAPQAQGNRPAR